MAKQIVNKTVMANIADTMITDIIRNGSMREQIMVINRLNLMKEEGTIPEDITIKQIFYTILRNHSQVDIILSVAETLG